jgi:hypothetical protein
MRLQIREGVAVFENGELAWHKAVIISDGIKGKKPFSQYVTTTFQDGSTITWYTKGTSDGGSTTKWTSPKSSES